MDFILHEMVPVVQVGSSHLGRLPDFSPLLRQPHASLLHGEGLSSELLIASTGLEILV